MCRKPINITNRAKDLYLNGTQPYKFSVPCGSCDECEKSKCQEYTFRSYYETQSTFDAGGYIYYDTLTYDNEHLPHLSDHLDTIVKGSEFDYPCFSRRNFRLFYQRLKQNIKNRFGDIPLGFFATSEYGEDERYTHRPHHHILLFVKSDKINWIDLSKLVSDAWFYGRTNGVKYCPMVEVQKHVYKPGSSIFVNDTVMQRVCSYVSKYVVKDSEFIRVVDARFKAVCQHLYGSNYKANPDCKVIKSEIYPFHRQSSGFGSDFLRYTPLELIEAKELIRIPNKNSVWSFMVIPQYLRRKIYYKLVRNADGTLKWELNDAGVQHNQRYVFDKINNVANMYRNWYDSLHTICPTKCDTYRQSVIDLLNGRSWFDFATYLVCYRGRILSKSQFEDTQYLDVVNHVHPLDKQVSLMYNKPLKADLYNYNCPCDYDEFRRKFVSTSNLGTKASDYHLKSHRNILTEVFVSDFAKSHTINQFSDERFKDFDTLYSIYESSVYKYNVDCLASYRLGQQVNSRFKTLFQSLI